MPIGLDPRLKKRLVDALSDGLPRMRLQNGMFLEPTGAYHAIAAAESALPEHGKVRDLLVRYVGEAPISTFVIDLISEKLYQLDRYNSDIGLQILWTSRIFRSTCSRDSNHRPT